MTAIRAAFTTLASRSRNAQQTIAHYRALRKLASGRTGVVYGAEDRKLGRRVALSQAVERFRCEARAVWSPNHSGSCTIHATEEHQAQTFTATELIEGRTLNKLIALRTASRWPAQSTSQFKLPTLDAAKKKKESCIATSNRRIFLSRTRPGRDSRFRAGQALAGTGARRRDFASRVAILTKVILSRANQDRRVLE